MAYGGVNEAWIVGAVRTPVGGHGGSLSAVRPDDLGALVLQVLMERTGVPPSEVEDVYFGCANQAGEDNRDVARMSLLLADFPLEVAGATVNRLCGSGLEAVANAARAVMLGEADVYVGGGVESMSRAPYAMPKPEKGFATGNQTMYETTLGWRFVNPRMEEMGHTDSLGMTAENLAQERFQLTPEMQRPEELADQYDISRDRQPPQRRSGGATGRLCPVRPGARPGAHGQDQEHRGGRGPATSDGHRASAGDEEGTLAGRDLAQRHWPRRA